MSLLALNGGEAVAEAMRQVNPDVVAAYPITPQTLIMERFAEFVAKGSVDTELILVESEHSALSACVGAQAAGARTMTATSANGLALMWEILYVAASMALPIVMPVVNRALSGPINIHCDHSDSMGARDAGWIQLYSGTPQEAYDNVIQAFRIAEHPEVRLPVMVMQDGFITSHMVERVEVLEDRAVEEFIGPYPAPHALLDVDHPVTYGPLDLPDFYFEHKRGQMEALRRAFPVIEEVGRLYGEMAGRPYGLMEAEGLEGAEVALVVLSSAAETAKGVARALGEEGLRGAVLKPRVFRPFPAHAIREALKGMKAVAVLDRSVSFGSEGGPLYLEVAAALQPLARPVPLTSYIFGLGGRDIRPEDIREVFEDLEERAQTEGAPQALRFIGLRE